jgi:hypothetical protein
MTLVGQARFARPMSHPTTNPANGLEIRSWLRLLEVAWPDERTARLLALFFIGASLCGLPKRSDQSIIRQFEFGDNDTVARWAPRIAQLGLPMPDWEVPAQPWSEARGFLTRRVLLVNNATVFAKYRRGLEALDREMLKSFDDDDVTTLTLVGQASLAADAIFGAEVTPKRFHELLRKSGKGLAQGLDDGKVDRMADGLRRRGVFAAEAE